MGKVQFPVSEMERLAADLVSTTEAYHASSRLIEQARNTVRLHPADPNLIPSRITMMTIIVSRHLQTEADRNTADAELVAATSAAARRADAPGVGVCRPDTSLVDTAIAFGGRHTFVLDLNWWERLLDAGESAVEEIPSTADSAFGWIQDRYDEGRHRLRRAAGFVWDLPGEVYQDLVDGTMAALSAGDDLAIYLIMERLREIRLGLGYIAEMSPVAPLVPTGRRLWNHRIKPMIVTEIMDLLEEPFGRDDEVGGDPGGRFSTRERGPFIVYGGGAVERGRNAVVQGLADTADSERIQPDEFEIIDHGNDRYTLVLAGVTDLSNPGAGLNPHHQSVRDTDYAAARSTASAAIDDNLYAATVRDYVQANVPHGASIAIVGHSFGADTALDLAADPDFNGRYFHVTHVTAAAYHSEPQLPYVPEGTRVLVLQNNKDIPVIIEELGHAGSVAEMSPPARPDILIREFSGGWEGAGHHQNNYISFLSTTDDAAVEAYLGSLAEHGYSDDGQAEAVDISVSRNVLPKIVN